MPIIEPKKYNFSYNEFDSYYLSEDKFYIDTNI